MKLNPSDTMPVLETRWGVSTLPSSIHELCPHSDMVYICLQGLVEGVGKAELSKQVFIQTKLKHLLATEVGLLGSQTNIPTAH